MQIHLYTLKSSRCAGKPKCVKLLREAILSPLWFLCLFLTWKFDSAKAKPQCNMGAVVWQTPIQQTKSLRGEFEPSEIGLLFYSQTYNVCLYLKNLDK